MTATADRATPILTAVIASRLTSIGQRMGVVVERSAHSPLLVEGRDFSLGIYDRHGGLIEQTEYIPVLGYATEPAVRHIAQTFGEDISPGDVVLHNDPFSGGNQMSDWKVAKPVFHGSEHVAWVAINAHQAEVGGSVPGSYNPRATDLWQEALRITAVKVYEAGRLREDVWNLIFGNVRLPTVADDVRAMIGACNVGDRELSALVDRYGVVTFQQVVEEIRDATEAMVRAVIAEIPDGDYHSEVFALDDGIDRDRRMTIRLRVGVEGSRMCFDFTGTDDQTPGYVNAPLPATVSSVLIAFFMLAGREVPHNDGILRCIEVIAPDGSMLNPRYPAATGFGNHLSDQICTAAMLALAPALPDRVTAGWNPLLCAAINGVDARSGRPFVDLLLNACKGGSGGTYGADGYDHIGLIAAAGAVAAQDPEVFELTNPAQLRKFEYLPDSAGAGQWRGGVGVETIFEFTSGGIQASFFGDGAHPESTAQGVLGGEPGRCNEVELTYPDGTVHRPRVKDLMSDIPQGTVYRQVAGGGGGYGDPHERPAEVVSADVRNGFVSVAEAEARYAVAVDALGVVDEQRTAELRR